MRFLSPKQVITPLKITPGQKVADFGCGKGSYVFELSDKVTNSGLVYAIDIHKALLLKIAKEAEVENITNVRTLWADLEQISGTGIESNSLDAIVISNVLFQISDKGSFVKEIIRTIKQNGQVLVIDWSMDNSIRYTSSDVAISEDSIKELFTEDTFELLQKVEAGDHHHGYIYRKI